MTLRGGATVRLLTRFDGSERLWITTVDPRPSAGVLEHFAEASLVSLELVTGRQHQVRVQAMCHEHPLLGERIYVGSHGASVARAFRRQALHAAALTFPHTVSRKPVVFEAPLPGDLRHLLRRLRKSPTDA